MNLGDVGNFIIKSAPMLGLALGGPVGAAAGEAASLLASVFGGNPNDAQDLVKRITADPQAAEKLMQLEKDNLDRGIQLNQMHYADIENARDREVKLAQIAASVGQQIDNTPRVLALLYTSFYLVAMVASIAATAYFPQLNFVTATAALGNGEMFILGYYFGSSNKDKGQKQ